MSASVLFDAPGPRTVARHRVYNVVAVLLVAAAVAWALWRLYDDGQFEADKWEVFTTPDYVRVLLVDGLLNTLKMAFLAILGAVVLGFVLGVGKLSEHALVRWPAWLVVEFFRAVPVLLLMVFTWYAIGINKDGSPFWAVVIALTLYNGSVLAEVLRAGVLAVPAGQAEAAYAIGMRKTQVMNIILMPQAAKIMLPAIISQCVVALKDTALGIFVTAPGLTFVSKQIYLEFNNRVPTMIVVAALYIVVNLLLTLLASWVQRRYVGEKSPLDLTRVGTMDGGQSTAV
ncbi:amino acid ABC transporter permease [Nocardioides lianchengensis]|uniref:Glutamate transport system permease protein n=1 Tax=Nocardioides lianchengensis TaxID=1045774 RepID=A0A1G6Z974_9ACTN|nr:amino acid ABC transporter permease [Nocardioides lianchengensis]NYG11472.1 glutamate transport system permease protein [Nocardioides lianchengensis]SDD99071.1 glutamate transport system permease protein [Nocardioides lianchengensis]